MCCASLTEARRQCVCVQQSYSSKAIATASKQQQLQHQHGSSSSCSTIATQQEQLDQTAGEAVGVAQKQRHNSTALATLQQCCSGNSRSISAAVGAQQ